MPDIPDPHASTMPLAEGSTSGDGQHCFVDLSPGDAAASLYDNDAGTAAVDAAVAAFVADRVDLGGSVCVGGSALGMTAVEFRMAVDRWTFGNVRGFALIGSHGDFQEGGSIESATLQRKA